MKEFNKYINNEIDAIALYSERPTKRYADKLFRGKEDPDDPVSLSGIRDREFNTVDSLASVVQSKSKTYYDRYNDTIEIYVEIMAALAALKQGREDKFNAYIDAIRALMNNRAGSIGPLSQER